jgi:hypothetical protein
MIFTIWLFNIAMENHLKIEVLIGKSSINGPSIPWPMLNNQRVEAETDENQAFVWFFHDLSAV